MRLNKILILFISILFFLVEALSNGTNSYGLTLEKLNNKHLQFKKTETKEINFFNFMFEEDKDSSENEDDSESGFHYFILNDSKYLTFNADHFISKFGQPHFKEILSFSNTPIFILHQNIRL